MISRIIFLLMALLYTIQTVYAEIEMADRLRSEGKIYVVIACIVVIFAGILIYLIRLDRKIKNLEKKIER